MDHDENNKGRSPGLPGKRYYLTSAVKSSAIYSSSDNLLAVLLLLSLPYTSGTGLFVTFSIYRVSHPAKCSNVDAVRLLASTCQIELLSDPFTLVL